MLFRKVALAAVAALVAIAAASPAAVVVAKNDKVKTKIYLGTLQVTGSNDAESITLRLRSGDSTTLEVAVDGSLICNDEALALRAAVDGLGVLWTLRSLVAADIAAGRLIELLPQHAMTFSSWFLYYPSRRQVRAPLQALIDFLKRGLQERRQ